MCVCVGEFTQLCAAVSSEWRRSDYSAGLHHWHLLPEAAAGVGVPDQPGRLCARMFV